MRKAELMSIFRRVGPPPPDFEAIWEDPARFGEVFKGADLMAVDFMKATFSSRETFCTVVDFAVDLAGFNACMEETTGNPRLTEDEIDTFVSILEKMDELPRFKNNPDIAYFRKKVAPWKKHEMVSLSPAELTKYEGLLRGLAGSPGEFFTVTRNESFVLQWRQELLCRGFQDIGQYAKHPSTIKVLQQLDVLLRSRFCKHAKSGSGTTVSCNSALVLLLRFDEYIEKGHTAIGDSAIDNSAKLCFALFSKLQNASTEARIPISPVEVRLLERLYCQQSEHLCPKPATSIQESLPSRRASTLLNLELHATYWLEEILNMADTTLSEAKLSEDEMTTRLKTVTDMLGTDPFKPYIPKVDLLKAFKQNLPRVPHHPMFLAPEHRYCNEKVKGLQWEIDEWDQWTTEEAFPMLSLLTPAEKAKIGTTSRDVLSGAIRALTCMVDNSARDVAEKSVELGKYRAESAKREAADRKKKEELRAEVKAKELRIQELEKAVRDKPVANPELENVAQMQKDLKEEERRLHDREEQLKLREEEFKTLQRKHHKETSKYSKKGEAQMSTLLRNEKAKVSELEKKLEASTEALRILQLDSDAISAEMQEIKKAKTSKKAKVSQDDDARTTITKLQEEVDRYKALYQATRSNETIVRDQIKKAVLVAETKKDAILAKALEEKEKELLSLHEDLKCGQKKDVIPTRALEEKDKELHMLREDLERAQKFAADKSVEDKEKMVVELATRDRTILELSQARLRLQAELTNINAQLQQKDLQIENLNQQSWVEGYRTGWLGHESVSQPSHGAYAAPPRAAPAIPPGFESMVAAPQAHNLDFTNTLTRPQSRTHTPASVQAALPSRFPTFGSSQLRSSSPVHPSLRQSTINNGTPTSSGTPARSSNCSPSASSPHRPTNTGHKNKTTRKWYE